MSEVKNVKDMIKKIDTDQVLESLIQKFSQIEQIASGTEINDVFKGISDITKTAISPFKMITAGIQGFKKSMNEWEKLQLENSKKNDNNQTEEDFPKIDFSDIAKDNTVLDLSDHIKELIHQNDSDFSLLDKSVNNSRYFLEDISRGVQMLIYGNDSLLDQLQKNQQNTKVFQVQKKEMTAEEKRQQQNQIKSLSLLENIQEAITEKDEELTNKIIDAIQPDPELHQSNDEKKSDADFNNNDINDEESPKEKEKENQEKESLKNTKGIFHGIKLLGKYSAHLIKLATLSALKAAAILSMIALQIVGIDLLQAVIRAKLDELGVTWDNWFEILPGKIWESMKEGLEFLFNNAVVYPLDTLGLLLKSIGMVLNRVKFEIKSGFANLLDSFGFDDTADEIRKDAVDTYNGEVKSHNEYVDRYDKRNQGMLFHDIFGKDIVEFAKFKNVEEIVSDAIKENNKQIQIDKTKDPDQIKTLQNGSEISLNTSIHDLTKIADQLSLSNNQKDKESQEYLRELIDIAQKRNEYAKIQLDKEMENNGTQLKNISGYGFANLSKEKQQQLIEANKKANKDSEIQKFKNDFDSKNNVNDIKPTNVELKTKQISEQERQLAEITSPWAQRAKAVSQEKNSVQLNNQNNTTNIINQPLGVQNPYYWGAPPNGRTNIGSQ